MRASGRWDYCEARFPEPGRRVRSGSGGRRSSDGDDDLPELAAVLQIAMRFHHVFELECTIDDRLERAARKTFDDVFHGVPPASLVTHHLPNAVSLHVRHLRAHARHGPLAVPLAPAAVELHSAPL